MRTSICVASVLGILIAPLAVWYCRANPRTHSPEIELHGNVDLRQVDLAFNNSERIDAVLVQEGDRVSRGQILARLDTRRLEPPVANAQAQVNAQRSVVERLKNGSRKEELAQSRAQVAAQQAVVNRLKNGSRAEEIAQAQANANSARADVELCRLKYERLQQAASSSAGHAISQQDVDNAKGALAIAEAKLVFNDNALKLAIDGPRKEEIAQAEATLANLNQALELAVAGPRQEDIDQAAAQLHGLEAQLGLLQKILDDATLIAPVNAVVRSRVMEPGEMSAPQRPVLSLAITDLKWVRAYVAEPDLGKLRAGQKAAISVDSFPQTRFDGWIGFISPVAEFTPKTVQTEELRTSLVYEVRVFVNDPSDNLRLGMPATVRILTADVPAGEVLR